MTSSSFTSSISDCPATITFFRTVQHRIRELANAPDLLIHDATYDEEERERAVEVFHSTASEAGEAATALDTRVLALVHISSRYTTAAGHIRDAGKSFSGKVLAPSDLELLEIAYRDE